MIDADVVAVMVPDSPDVSQVLAGDGGVFETAKPGTLIIDFSSIRPDVTTELADQASSRGFGILDAPVSGGEAGAIAGTLSIMVGGDPADFEAAARFSRPSGRPIVHVGPSGAGQTVKAANQLIVAGNIQLLAEAVAFVEAYGVDTEAALKVLGGGLAGSKVLDQKGANMLNRSFQPGFRIDLHHKDLGHRHRGGPRGRRRHPARVPSSPNSWPRPGPTATAGWTTRRCCAACSGSPGRTRTDDQR